MSQASQLNKEKSNEGERQPDKSNIDDITWNEDYSQNELTFPTISGSAPNVISFDSDSVDVVDGAEGVSNDFSSVNTNTMTESTLIAIEANKMVTVSWVENNRRVGLISAVIPGVQTGGRAVAKHRQRQVVGLGLDNAAVAAQLTNRQRYWVWERPTKESEGGV